LALRKEDIYLKRVVIKQENETENNDSEIGIPQLVGVPDSSSGGVTKIFDV
jgi:hypothetical protein